IADWNNAAIRALWLDAQVVVFFSRCANCKVPTVKGVDGRVTQIRYSGPELAALRDLAFAIKDRKETNAIVKPGAILHADVVMLVHPEGEIHVNQPRSPLSSQQGRSQAPSTPDRLMLKSMDGRQKSLRDDAIHWDISYALLEQVVPDYEGTQVLSSGDIKKAPDDTVRLWYRATTAYLQAKAIYDPYHHSRGLKAFPNDPDLHFLNGCLHESQADARVQTVMRDLDLPPGVSLSQLSERDELEAAEKAFRRTLEVDPAYYEARIPLGRVLGKLGKHEQA